VLSLCFDNLDWEMVTSGLINDYLQNDASLLVDLLLSIEWLFDEDRCLIIGSFE
jgi:hypothetical protein